MINNKIYYIYCLQNTENNKIYIGQTINLKTRMYYHKTCKKPYPLYNSIRKYGWNKFKYQILETHDNLEDCNEAETFYISMLNSQNREIGYNISPGGDGHIGKPAWNKGLKGWFKQSDEHKIKLLLSDGAKGSKRSNSFKKRQSLKQMKFTKKQEQEIILLIGTLSYRKLAKKFNCSHGTIINIVKRNQVIS